MNACCHCYGTVQQMGGMMASGLVVVVVGHYNTPPMIWPSRLTRLHRHWLASDATLMLPLEVD